MNDVRLDIELVIALAEGNEAFAASSKSQRNQYHHKIDRAADMHEDKLNKTSIDSLNVRLKLVVFTALNAMIYEFQMDQTYWSTESETFTHSSLINRSYLNTQCKA